MANIAPSGADSTITIAEDTPYVFKAGDFGFSDPDFNNLQSVIITAYGGTLKLNGLDVAFNTEIPLASIPDLVWIPPEDASGDGLGAVMFKVVDDGGTADGGKNTDPIANMITFNVTAANDAPTVIAPIEAQFAEQDNAFAFTIPAGAFFDIDGDQLEFSITVNGDPVLPGWLQFDATSRTLSGTPDAADLGDYVLQIIATDPGGKQAVQEVQLTVDDRNFAPSGTTTAVAVNEDQAYQFSVSDFGFTDQDGNQMQSVKVVALPSFGTLTLDGVAVVADQIIDVTTIDLLVWTPPANLSGQGLAALSFQVIDDGTVGGNSANIDPSPKYVIFNVAPVNDAPVLDTQLPDAGVEIGTAFTLFFPAGAISDADAGDTFEYGATLEDGSALPDWLQIDTASGALSGTAPDGSAGVINIKMTVTDSGGLAVEDVFALTISAPNLPPQGAEATIDLLEDAVHQFAAADFVFEDAEGDVLDSVVIISLPTTGSLIYDEAGFMMDAYVGQVIKLADIGNLAWAAPANQSGNGLGTFTFKALVSDGAGGVVEATGDSTISFNLAAVPDAPSGADKTITVTEDVPYVFTVDDFGFSDVVENDAFTSVIFSTLPGKGTLTLDGVAVTENQEVLVADITKLSWSTDENAVGDAYATLSFTVKDSGGTLNGGLDTDDTANILTFDITDVVDIFNGTKGKNTLVGTDGMDVFNGKAGNDKLTGGAGVDTFIFRTGCDKDTIFDFDAIGEDHDVLNIARLDSIKNFRDLRANHMTQSGDNVVINGLNGDVITLKNVKIADLDAGDFIF